MFNKPQKMIKEQKLNDIKEDSDLQVPKYLDKLMKVKILRPITIPIFGAILVTCIIVWYIFDLEM